MLRNLPFFNFGYFHIGPNKGIEQQFVCVFLATFDKFRFKKRTFDFFWATFEQLSEKSWATFESPITNGKR